MGAAKCIRILMGSVALACQPASAHAEVGGWKEFIQGIQDLPSQMLAKLPEEMQQDPQIRQEIARLALASLASSTIGALGSDAQHPVFLPSIGQVLSNGQPNADTVYRSAIIDPKGVYRLRGQRGSLRMVRVAQVGPRPKPSTATANGAPDLGPQRIDHDLNALEVDAEGRYDVIVSATRPQGYTGDWWELRPSTNRLMMRMVGADWAGETDPTISIERLDRPVARPRVSGEELEKRLRALPDAVRFSALLFPDHVARLRAEGYVNRIKPLDLSNQGGLARQFYYEGAYELNSDEALIIETQVPKQCGYRSLILTNSIYETTDWYNNHSSLNDTQAQPDPDGILRVVISEKDPGAPNWLDTAGYSRGAFQGRWTDCDSQPIPTVRKVPMKEVRRWLPDSTRVITPEQREQIVRERRATLQQRPLW